MDRNKDARDGGQPVSLTNLRGLRLGRCARRILLLAPPPLSEPAVLPPERAGRGAAESHRRAMRFLAANGLVELSWKTEMVETKQERRSPAVVWDSDAGVYQEVEPERAPVQRAIERRAVKLTVLGEFLVDRLRPVLESGRRIRWDVMVDLEHNP
jgi:hypothetical protein